MYVGLAYEYDACHGPFTKYQLSDGSPLAYRLVSIHGLASIDENVIVKFPLVVFGE
jgi:hypothetical protein